MSTWSIAAAHWDGKPIWNSKIILTRPRGRLIAMNFQSVSFQSTISYRVHHLLPGWWVSRRWILNKNTIITTDNQYTTRHMRMVLLRFVVFVAEWYWLILPTIFRYAGLVLIAQCKWTTRRTVSKSATWIIGSKIIITIKQSTYKPRAFSLGRGTSW